MLRREWYQSCSFTQPLQVSSPLDPLKKKKTKKMKRVEGMKSKMGIYWSRGMELIQSSTVEVSLFFLMISNLAIYTISEDLSLDKACRVNLNYSETICQSIRNRNESVVAEEGAMQVLVSTVKSAYSPVDYGIPILLMMVLGPLSDIFGRKVPMVLAMSGSLLQYAGVILSAYFPSVDLWTFKFILSIPRAIGGGEAAFNMAAMAYISDMTPNNPSLRTLRTGLLYSFFVSGVPVGSAFGARLSSWDLGYVGSLSLASVPGVLGFFLVLLFTKNTRNGERVKEVEGMTSSRLFLFILNPKSTWLRVYRTLTQKREGWTRVNILSILFAHFCVMAPMSAEFTVRYLFLRIQLNWNLVQFGDYSTFSYIVGIGGVILSMGILSAYLQLSDPVVGFIAGFSQFGSCFLYAFARTSFLMYLAPVIDMMNGTMIVVNKSILSQILPPEELGNLFAVVGVVDSVSPLILVPVYNIVYKGTFQWLPGAFYLLSAALTIPAFFVFGWLIGSDLRSGRGFFQPTKGTTVTKC